MNVSDIVRGARGVATKIEGAVADVFGGASTVLGATEKSASEILGTKAARGASTLQDALSSGAKVRAPLTGPAAPSGIGPHPAQGKLGWGGLFDHVSNTGGFGYNMARGGMLLGGAAVLGSGLYGAASIAMPANAEANNPFKNAIKGVGYGVAAGALYAATKGLGGEGLRGMVNPEISSKLGHVQRGAKMVSGAFDNKLVSGAIGAAVIAGSGDLTLTKPVNPVY